MVKATAAVEAFERRRQRDKREAEAKARANPAESYEANRKVRDAIIAERAAQEERERSLAEQMVAITNRQFGHAYALIAARCDDEDDAKRRIRADESTRSRQRMPIRTLYLDGVKAWTGAFENGTIDEGVAHWLERWHAYASRELPFYVRWMSEPMSTLREVEGQAEAAIMRDDRKWHSRGATPEAAIEALYTQIDAEPEAPPETVQ